MWQFLEIPERCDGESVACSRLHIFFLLLGISTTMTGRHFYILLINFLFDLLMEYAFDVGLPWYADIGFLVYGVLLGLLLRFTTGKDFLNLLPLDNSPKLDVFVYVSLGYLLNLIFFLPVDRALPKTHFLYGSVITNILLSGFLVFRFFFTAALLKQTEPSQEIMHQKIHKLLLSNVFFLALSQIVFAVTIWFPDSGFYALFLASVCCEVLAFVFFRFSFDDGFAIAAVSVSFKPVKSKDQ